MTPVKNFTIIKIHSEPIYFLLTILTVLGPIHTRNPLRHMQTRYISGKHYAAYSIFTFLWTGLRHGLHELRITKVYSKPLIECPIFTFLFLQRSYTRWLNKIIYETETKFWAVLGSLQRKNLPSAISMQLFGVVF